MNFRAGFTIRGKRIGEGSPCYIVAEIGNNHNGSPEAAKALIRAAAAAGADAVKFQTFRARDIVSPRVPADAYPGFDVSDRFKSWIEFVETLELPYDAYDQLIREARSLKLGFISTPASLEALELLVEKRVDAIKIASMDLNNIPFVERVGQTGLPAILSTGMSTLEEVREAVESVAHSPLAILHCVSSYPLKYEDANLLNILTLRETFSVPIGFSNHALGHDLDIAAVALGARIIEKHFTMNRENRQMAEHHFSMEPHEFKEMVSRIRVIEKTLSSRARTFCADEARNRFWVRRSVFLARDVEVGEEIRFEDLRCIRPATSVEPKDLPTLIGTRARRRIGAYEPFSLDDIEKVK